MAALQVVLPMCEVDNQAERIPSQDASQTCANYGGVRRFDVLIRLLVDGQDLLAFISLERWVDFWVDILQQDGEPQTFRQTGMSPFDDSRCQGPLLLNDKISQQPVRPRQSEDVAGVQKRAYFEQEFVWEIQEATPIEWRSPHFPLLFLPKAFGTLRMRYKHELVR